MAVVRVQVTQTIAGGPSVGTWNVYRGAWFTVSGGASPNATVQTLLSRLFNGHHPSGTLAYSILDYRAYEVGSTAQRIKTWTLEGGSLVPAGNVLRNLEALPPQTSPTRWFPLQSAIAIGYRADLGEGVPRQRGRSRWFLGPLMIAGNVLDGSSQPGGPRLSPAGVDRLATNARDGIQALAAEGWVLGVRVQEGATLAPAVEVYVDDVLDVMRSHRPWQLYQKRLSL